MGVLISGVTALVRAEAPDHETRWSDSLIQSCIFISDAAIREEIEVEWASYEFDMVDGAIYYSLPTDIIGIQSVELSRDSGTTYDVFLNAVTLSDMDHISYTWQTDTGSEPEMFFLQSVPGTSSYSKIGLWRPVVTAGSQKIRVNYTKSVSSVGSLSGVTMPDEIQQEVYLPKVMSILMVGIDAREAIGYHNKFKSKIGWARARFGHNKTEDAYRPGSIR